MYAAVEFLITTPQTISIALGAALIAVAGYQTLLVAMAVTIGMAAVYLLTRPEQRSRDCGSAGLRWGGADGVRGATRAFLRYGRNTAETGRVR